ncbi:hypothetical protein QJS10_CPA08g01324 [Acorus calamus]|uniref:Uncharacterized protein n=1 Tax=Acorus calamus TaxID=4465 RepID=A0AAV9EAU6_ACOCL|nr:hypothetical protein QJS10_CPA08g01324 [Acorus calamus]
MVEEVEEFSASLPESDGSKTTDATEAMRWRLVVVAVICLGFDSVRVDSIPKSSNTGISQMILYPVIHISSTHRIPIYSSLNIHPTNLICKNKYDRMLKNEIPCKGGLVTSSLDTTEGHQVGGDLEEGCCSGVIRRSVRLDRPIPSAEGAYNLYNTLANHTGWGWDATLKMAVPGDARDWQTAIHENKKFRSCRNKPFIYYDDIQMICGTHSAQGFHGVGIDEGALPSRTQSPPEDEEEDDDEVVP